MGKPVSYTGDDKELLDTVSKQKEEIVGECADLFYHTLVLLADAGVTLSDVCTELKDRH